MRVCLWGASLIMLSGAAVGAATEDQVIGTWRLVETRQVMTDGSVRPNPTYGPNGVGYIMYDRSHRMCVFLTNPDRTEPKAGQPRGPVGSSMYWPAAYCGTWSIDPKGPAILHMAEMDAAGPSAIGSVRRRLFERQGDRLILRPDGARGRDVKDYTLHFQRIPETPIAPQEEALIGVWRLHHTEQKMSDGSSRTNPIYGPNGIGYLIYDRTHHMCVFLTNPDGAKPVVDWPRGEPGSTMWNSAIYCGPWSYDPSGPAIVHRPDVDTATPEDTAVVRRRPFQLDGRMLTLRPDRVLPPGVVEHKLIFEKVAD